jgi:hypothetical protein
MPLPGSSLSVAVQAIAVFLDSQFTEEVNITVAHPQRASEIAKGAGATAHCLNLFAYRVAPSGFHADAGSDETHFLRINVLLTPFPADIDTATEDVDLRILGHALRVLQSHPVLPITTAPLPAAAMTEPPNRKDYRLESILLAPTMEEINHIWTTQGGELAYRLSAVYEIALIPIEPLQPRVTAPPPEAIIIDSRLGVEDAAGGFNHLSEDSRAYPLDTASTPPTQWLPVQMLVAGDDSLTNTLKVASGATGVTLAIAGPQAASAAMLVSWLLDDNSGNDQTEQVLPIGSPLLDDAEARVTLLLAIPANAVSASIRIRPAANGTAIPDSPFGNVLTLTVGDA